MYGVSIEVATLGVSVYQLGFAFGPLVWVSPVPRPLLSSSDQLTPYSLGTAIGAVWKESHLSSDVLHLHSFHVGYCSCQWHCDYARLPLLCRCIWLEHPGHISCNHESAARLTKTTGYVYRSLQAPTADIPFATTMRVSLIRPFQMLFQEFIVAFFAVYSGFKCEFDKYPTHSAQSLTIPLRWSPVRILRRVPLVRYSSP